jgi:hypothetical protein
MSYLKYFNSIQIKNTQICVYYQSIELLEKISKNFKLVNKVKYQKQKLYENSEKCRFELVLGGFETQFFLECIL